MAWKLFFCAGVGSLLLLPALCPPIALALIGAASLCLCLWALSGSRRRSRKSFLFLACFTLGSSYAQWQAQLQLAQRLPESLDGYEYEIEGRIHGVVALSEGWLYGELRRKARFDFHVHSIRALEGAVQPAVARLRLSYYGDERIESGQRWRMVVRLRSPRGWVNPGGFDLARHALGSRIHAYGYVRDGHPIVQLASSDSMSLRLARHGALQPLVAPLAYPAILNALLLGDKSSLSDAQRELFIATGTAHLMAISGLHIATAAAAGAMLAKWLIGLLPRLLLFISAPTAMLCCAIPAAIFYAALSGFAVSTQRALVMLLCASAAILLRRRGSAWSILCTAATGLLVFDPLALLGGGFWLSFFAVAVLLLAAQGAVTAAAPTQKIFAFLQPLKVLLSAQCALFFGMPVVQLGLGLPMPLIAPLANLLAVPVVSFWVIPAGLTGLLASYLHGGLAAALLKFADVGLAMAMRWLQYLQQLSLGNVRIEGELGGLGIVLATLSAAVLLTHRRGPLVPLASLLWLVLFAMPLLQSSNNSGQLAPGELSLWQFDVGQGTAVLVRTTNSNLLFDTGGTFGFGRDAGSSTIVPALRHMGIAELDAVILSHGDSDHTGGAESLSQAIKIEQWYTGGSAAKVLPAGAHAKPCRRGISWRIDDVAFYFLNDSARDQSENDASCVLMIRSLLAGATNKNANTPVIPAANTATGGANTGNGAGGVLLTGDIELDGEIDLLPLGQAALAARVLMAPHHGSKTSSTESLLNAVRPAFALFSSGYRNRYGHPHAAILKRYEVRGIRVLRSDFHGAIRLDFKGGRWLSPQCSRFTHRHFWVYRQPHMPCGCQLRNFSSTGCDPRADDGGL